MRHDDHAGTGRPSTALTTRAIVLIGLLIGLAGGGCISTSYTGETAAATTHVDVYRSEAELRRPHRVLGEIEARTTPGMSIASVEPELVAQARRRGADGLVILGSSDRTVGWRLPEGRVVPTDDPNAGRGTAVREQVVTARLVAYE